MCPMKKSKRPMEPRRVCPHRILWGHTLRDGPIETISAAYASQELRRLGRYGGARAGRFRAVRAPPKGEFFGMRFPAANFRLAKPRVCRGFGGIEKT